MEYTKIFYRDDLLENNAVSKATDILHELQNIISDKNALLIGDRDDVLDLLDNGKLYYAVPQTHELVVWPKIRPFRTVAVDVNALPFAPGTFYTVVINHYLEFSHKNTKFLSEVFRILKRDGKLITIAHNSRNLPGKTRSIKEIVSDITEASFHLSNICGISKNAGLPSYSFNYDQNKFSKILLGPLCLFSDIVILTADKTDVVADLVPIFEERYV
ncbi:MAG: class I SAM-dependent methyltransferase [Holosporaceae bacterium]|jgi:SAM-dependent methyltransferase|nr:class I SAM-dependent methyltransferase [Holosporaceae bacterium]